MDERELVRKILDGDDKAWARFIELHGARVHGAILELRELLPELVANALDPDRLTLEVFSTLLEDNARRLRKIGPNADIGAWLVMIARRLTLKRTRTSKRYRKLSGEMEAAQLEESPLRENLREELADLPPRDRLVLELFFFEGLHPHTIAEHVGLSGSQINKFLGAAFERLRARVSASR